MLDPQAECPECGVKLGGRANCHKCGWGKPADKKAAGNGLPFWVSPPPYVKPADDSLCGEPLADGSGFCRKTVAQHRAEFLAFGERIARRVVRL